VIRARLLGLLTVVLWSWSLFSVLVQDTRTGLVCSLAGWLTLGLAIRLRRNAR